MNIRDVCRQSSRRGVVLVAWILDACVGLGTSFPSPPRDQRNVPFSLSFLTRRRTIYPVAYAQMIGSIPIDTTPAVNAARPKRSRQCQVTNIQPSPQLRRSPYHARPKRHPCTPYAASTIQFQPKNPYKNSSSHEVTKPFTFPAQQ
jgi:hypothetical protein